MMLMLVLQVIFLLVSTLALGGPTEVPDKCSTSSPNYCVCKGNDTVLLKPVTPCLSPTDQNDQFIDCFPCFVSDQDLLNCVSLKDGYPVCPRQQFQSGESRIQLYFKINYMASKPNSTKSITKPTQETFRDLRYNGTLNKTQSYKSDTASATNYSINRDDFHRRLTTEFKSEYAEQNINSVNKSIQKYLDFDKILGLPTKPSKKLIDFIENNIAAIEQLGDMWYKILRLYQHTDMFEFDNAEEMNGIESNYGNNTLLLNITGIKSATAGYENNETFGQQSSEIGHVNLRIYESNASTKEDNVSGTELKSNMPGFNRYKIHKVHRYVQPNKIPKYISEKEKIQRKSDLENKSYARKEIESFKSSEKLLGEKAAVIPVENKTNFNNIDARYTENVSANAYNVTSTTSSIQAEVLIDSSNFGNSEKFMEGYPQIKNTARKPLLDQVDTMSNTGKYLAQKLLLKGNLSFKAGTADLEAQNIFETVTIKNLSIEKDLNSTGNVNSNASMASHPFQYDGVSSNHSEEHVNTNVRRKVSENSTEEDSSFIENFELPTPMDVSKVNIDSSLNIQNTTFSRAKSTGKKHSHSSYKRLRPSHLKFKNRSRYRSTSLPYEFNYVSKLPDENNNIFKDLNQSADAKLKNESFSKTGRSLLLNTTDADEAIAFLSNNESDVRSRSKRSTYPHNNWCYIAEKRRNGNLNCTLWSYKKDCLVSCHKGFEIEGKPSLKFSCDRKYNKWEPKSISQACKESDTPPKERPQQQFHSKTVSPNGNREEYDPNSTTDYIEEPRAYVEQQKNGEAFDYSEGFLSDSEQLDGYVTYPEVQMNSLGDYEQTRYPDYDIGSFESNHLDEAEYDTKN